VDHGARSHAKYSGSNAHRFTRCSGQVGLAAKIGVEIDSPDSEAGTAAHELLDAILRCEAGGNDGGDVYEITQMLADENYKQHQKSVWQVLDYINLLRDQYPDLVVESEIYRQFPQSVVPPDDAAGLIDVWCWSPSARIAWVIDFKNGVGETVDIEGNMQLLFYGTAALWHTSFAQAFLVVIQPNSFRGAEPRVIEVTGLDLVEYQADIENAIRAAESQDAVLVPGDHCHRCPAGHGCLARERQAIAVLTGDTRPVREFDSRSLPLPAELPLDRIGHIKSQAPAIRRWLKDVDAYAFHVAVVEGKHVPGHKVVEDKPERRYDPALTADAIYRSLVRMSGDRLSIDQVMPQKLIAMTNAENLLVETLREAAPLDGKAAAAKRAKDLFATLLEKDSRGVPALVADTDPRPALNRVLNDFAGVVPAEAIT
jgi:Protein of unknown function (DUF2800)